MSKTVRFEKILYADVIRDGGSYEAGFETSDHRVVVVFLARYASDDQRKVRHKHLYVFEGYQMPTNAIPVLSSSEPETRLINALELAQKSADSAEPNSDNPEYYRDRLKELIDYAKRRDPTFPADIESMHSRNERLRAAIAEGRENPDHYTFSDQFAI